MDLQLQNATFLFHDNKNIYLVQYNQVNENIRYWQVYLHSQLVGQVNEPYRRLCNQVRAADAVKAAIRGDKVMPESLL